MSAVIIIDQYALLIFIVKKHSRTVGIKRILFCRKWRKLEYLRAYPRDCRFPKLSKLSSNEDPLLTKGQEFGWLTCGQLTTVCRPPHSSSNPWRQIEIIWISKFNPPPPHWDRWVI
jgi:hypothetical protein